MQLAALPIDEQRDRHAPGALAGDTPVGTITDHAGDARLSPLGQPFDGLDGLKGGLAQTALIHADEPLRRGPKDNRGLVAPAMWIAVFEWRVVQKRIPLA